MKKTPKINFRFIVITNRKVNEKRFLKIISDSSKNGVKAVQLREKDLYAGELSQLAKKIRSVLYTHTSLLINDRIDIALIAKAHGVHSPENGINAKYIKKYNLIAGKSVHSLKQAKLAEKSGYDYILFGPVFKTPSKVKYGSAQGLDKLKKICRSVKIPVFAVGGINPNRAAQCLNAGARGVAVIREVMESNNIKRTVKEFKEVLGEL